MPVTIPLLRTHEASFEDAFLSLERRREESRAEVDAAVARIVEDVRQRGDDALLDATERFDGYRLTRDQLRVTAREIEAARDALEPEDRDALTLAANRIRRFHAHVVPQSWELQSGGELLGQQLRPIARVAVYVPAFRAPLASSVLMLAIPASVAGVRELVLLTPGRETHPAILEAARLSGVTQIFRVGGAQAVAAVAFGTETLPRVDKIVGPGSVWTQAAKRLVFGQVGIDADAGPSEVLIVADDAADAELVAADLVAQAEHGEDSSVVLVTPSESLAQATARALDAQLADLPRRSVAEAALAGRSALIVTRDLDEAIDLANRYAPEHLQLFMPDSESVLPRIENAGAVFLGPLSTVPLGDYVAGPSHVLPTGGGARFFSPVGVEDFLKRFSVIRLDRESFEQVAGSAARLAELEGLHGHARAVTRRMKDDARSSPRRRGLDRDS